MATRVEYPQAHSYLLFQGGNDLPTLTLRRLRHACVLTNHLDPNAGALLRDVLVRLTTYISLSYIYPARIHSPANSCSWFKYRNKLYVEDSRLLPAVSPFSTSWAHNSTSDCTDYPHFNTVGTFSHVSMIRNSLYQDLW